MLILVCVYDVSTGMCVVQSGTLITMCVRDLNAVVLIVVIVVVVVVIVDDDDDDDANDDDDDDGANNDDDDDIYPFTA